MTRSPVLVLVSAVACATTLVLLACSSGPQPPSPGTRSDARNLARALASDGATSDALTRVDAMITQERPAAAAEILRDHAIPAAERTLASIRAVRTSTPEGGVLKDSLTDVYTRRVRAMRAYADALATTVEDFALLEALRTHRQREEQTARAMLEVESTARGELPPAPTTTKLGPTPPPANGTR